MTPQRWLALAVATPTPSRILQSSRSLHQQQRDPATILGACNGPEKNDRSAPGPLHLPPGHVEQAGVRRATSRTLTWSALEQKYVIKERTPSSLKQ